MAIEGFIGRPGSGKSYFLTQKAIKEADRDRLVFTNWGVDHPNVYFFTPDQLLDLPPGLVLIDEAHLWFPSRGALKLPMSWLAGMSQTRKKGWDLVWATQHERRIDSVVKDVTSWLWKCDILWTSGGKPLIFRRTCWEPEFFRNPRKKFTYEFSIFNQRVANAYATHETLIQAEHTIDPKDFYAARQAPTPAAAPAPAPAATPRPSAPAPVPALSGAVSDGPLSEGGGRLVNAWHGGGH